MQFLLVHSPLVAWAKHSMNATCEWAQISALPVARYLGKQAAQTWVESLEFRVVVFTMVMMVCVMTWITTLARSIVCAATTVLYKLQASGNEALDAPARRSARIAAAPSGACRLHKTDGGPPPGDPPC